MNDRWLSGCEKTEIRASTATSKCDSVCSAVNASAISGSESGRGKPNWAQLEKQRSACSETLDDDAEALRYRCNSGTTAVNTTHPVTMRARKVSLIRALRLHSRQTLCSCIQNQNQFKTACCTSSMTNNVDIGREWTEKVSDTYQQWGLSAARVWLHYIAEVATETLWTETPHTHTRTVKDVICGTVKKKN